MTTGQGGSNNAVRYALIGVAVCSALVLSWILFGWIVSLSGQHLDPWTIGVIGLVAVADIAMAVAAGGLVRRHAWGAYLVGVAAFLLAPLLAFVTLVAYASSVMPSPYNTGTGGIDPEDVFITVAFVLSLVTGWLGIRLGRALRRPREGQERA